MRWIIYGDAELFLDGSKDGGLEAREGKVERVRSFGMREVIFFGVALGGGVGDRRATGVGKTEDFGDFVETFADGVVKSGADDLEVERGGHFDDLGMAAGDDKG